MKIVLLGPPGAGKGTLAKGLKDHFNLMHISTGDMLREEMKNGTDLGKEAKKHIESGGLVPDEIVTKMVESKFKNDKNTKNGFMLDGFPRTKQQAEDLDKILAKVGQPLDCVLSLDASLSIVLERLTGRSVCRACGALYHIKNMPSKKDGVCDKCGGELYQRADDNEKTIKNRMEVYSKSTEPIIDFYKNKGLLKSLDANKEAEEVRQYTIKLLNG
ncbi:MAG: adenylate kinase [Candidatus Omnitrophica bacterium]|nr:adenylate kinase [Candidatus Omnitrophota bacterium]